MSLTSRYRATLNRDGRVVWWEHVYAFVPVPVSFSLFAVRYLQTIWPFVVTFVIAMGFALWSWRQDLIVHNTDDPDSTNRVRDKHAKVPLATKLYALTTFALFCWIIRQWVVQGHY